MKYYIFIGVVYSVQMVTSRNLELPNLHDFLVGVHNCDVRIIHNDVGITDPSSIQQYQFLPTTIASLTKYLGRYRVLGRSMQLDIARVKPLICRLSFTIFPERLPSKDSGWDLSELATRFYKAYIPTWKNPTWKKLESTRNLYPFVYCRYKETMESLIEPYFRDRIEFLGRIESTRFESDQTRNILCIPIKPFQLVSSTPIECFIVGMEENLVGLVQNVIQPPREWNTHRQEDWFGLLQRPVGYGEHKKKDLDLTSYLQPMNPFNPSSSSAQSINLYLLLTIFKKNNATLYNSNYWNGWPEISLTVFNIGNLSPFLLISNMAVTDYTGYYFLTCYSKPAVTFEFYLTPFDATIWYVLLSSFFLLVLLLWRYLMYKNYRGSFCPWMYVLGALLEDGVQLPTIVEGQAIFRWVFGPWIIISVFLTNCYNGLMITGLNSPLAGNTIATWKDLVCDYKDFPYTEEQFQNFPKNSTERQSNLHYQDIKDQETSLTNMKRVLPEFSRPSHCFALLSFPIGKQDHPLSVLTNFGLPEFVGFLYEQFESINYDMELTQHVLWLNLFHPKHRHIPKATKEKLWTLSLHDSVTRVEEEIVACGRAVFIASTVQLEEMREYLSLKYYWIKFYKSKDILISPFPVGVMFKGEGKSMVPHNYKALIETGIYGRLMKEKDRRRTHKRKQAIKYESHNVNKITMDGCILTLFILWGSLAVLGSCCWVYECILRAGFVVAQLCEFWRNFINRKNK
ncbi:hypothetical protein Fcan01_11864 [Folsomia candida]|uniref:Uncharacterized protein n=1 Tax=Folsomia candida TaxID=158441 RepID=A0A226EDP4_FOLCA|nr:hypothetical protein Fcan01_11864 [Folsomia candida]